MKTSKNIACKTLFLLIIQCCANPIIASELAYLTKTQESHKNFVRSLLISKSLLSHSTVDEYLESIEDQIEKDWASHKNYNNTKFEVYPGMQTLINLQSYLGEKLDSYEQDIEQLQQDISVKPEVSAEGAHEEAEMTLEEQALEKISGLKSCLSALNGLEDILETAESFAESTQAQALSENLLVGSEFLAEAEKLLYLEEVDTEVPLSEALELMQFASQALEKGLADSAAFLVSEESTDDVEDLNIVMLKKIEELAPTTDEKADVYKTVTEDSFGFAEALEIVLDQEKEQKMLEELEQAYEAIGIDYHEQVAQEEAEYY